jgi:hypothetical protein
MRSALSALTILVTGCTIVPRTPPPSPDGGVVVVAAEPQPARAPRGLSKVPPGHYPPRGQCRVWYQGRPPGHQPPPVLCESLLRRVPAGAFVLYGGRAWDTEYDWRQHERASPGSVPNAVLQVMLTVQAR